ISHLNEFYFYSVDKAEVILDSLRRYGVHHKLRKIGVGQRIFSREALTQFQELGPMITSKFVNFNISFQSYLQNVQEIDSSVLSTVSTHFQSLTMLSFPMDRLSLAALSN